MTDDLVIRTGSSIEPAEAARMDRTRMAVGRPTPVSKEVEGQGCHCAWVLCPWCGAMNNIALHDVMPLWFTCWNCGGPLKL